MHLQLPNSSFEVVFIEKGMKFRCMLLPGSSRSVEVFRVGRSKEIGSYHGLGYMERKTRESIINRCRFGGG